MTYEDKASYDVRWSMCLCNDCLCNECLCNDQKQMRVLCIYAMNGLVCATTNVCVCQSARVVWLLKRRGKHILHFLLNIYTKLAFVFTSYASYVLQGDRSFFAKEPPIIGLFCGKWMRVLCICAMNCLVCATGWRVIFCKRATNYRALLRKMNASFVYIRNELLRMCYRVTKTQDALSCRSFFAKEPRITGLFGGKWPIKIRHLMGLRHHVLRMCVWVAVCVSCVCPRGNGNTCSISSWCLYHNQNQHIFIHIFNFLNAYSIFSIHIPSHQRVHSYHDMQKSPIISGSFAENECEFCVYTQWVADTWEAGAETRD